MKEAVSEKSGLRGVVSHEGNEAVSEIVILMVVSMEEAALKK